MQSIVPVVLSAALISMSAAGSTPPAAPHIVTMHIESLRGQSVRVHIKSDSAGIWLRGGGGYRTEMTIETPNDVVVGPTVSHVELRTEINQPVRIQFTDGATDAEKALHPWGWVMSFRRVNGDLQPEAKVVPAEPARTRRN